MSVYVSFIKYYIGKMNLIKVDSLTFKEPHEKITIHK
jgi:hypothetical protein